MGEVYIRVLEVDIAFVVAEAVVNAANTGSFTPMDCVLYDISLSTITLPLLGRLGSLEERLQARQGHRSAKALVGQRR